MKSFKQLSTQEQEQRVRPLLDYLASGDHHTEGQWADWHITRIASGLSSVLYRVTSSLGDLVIKFMIHFPIRDERDRAGREYGGLLALHQAGLSIAPKPMLLDPTSYAHPVVVQTWLDGEVKATPPITEAEWTHLLSHLALIHTVTPGKTRVRLPNAMFNVRHAEDARQIVQQQVACIPHGARPDSLQALLRWFEAFHFPDWSAVPVALCRLDNNILNYIRRPERWRSVDWECSGWSDPALDIADVMAHPAYIEVPSSRWEWVVETYCRMVHDMTASVRIQMYYKILMVWWVARLARWLYEISEGLDGRSTPWSQDWLADRRAKYKHYLGLAEALYS